MKDRFCRCDDGEASVLNEGPFHTATLEIQSPGRVSKRQDKGCKTIEAGIVAVFLRVYVAIPLSQRDHNCALVFVTSKPLSGFVFQIEGPYVFVDGTQLRFWLRAKVPR